MKIIINTVPQSQVVRELLDAMNRSIDRFSQDRSFDFRLVRIDQFLVPPRYVERYDDACFSYSDKKNPHPPNEAMEPILARSRQTFFDDDCLRYAAILYRSGDFGKDAHWGAYFYFWQLAMPEKPQRFTRLDCREKIAPQRVDSPVTYSVYQDYKFHGENGFSLAWALAWAAKEITLEGEFTYHPTQNPRPETPADEIAQDFHRFQSGLGEIDSLVKKAVDEQWSARLLLRYGWACAAMQKVRPMPMGVKHGAGRQIEKLFSELKTENA